MLIKELNVIINIAASVDFNERICDALQINYFGCIRMLQLASECKNLSIYTHVSTCYVNCEKKGFIHEKIYEIEEDSEIIVNNIMKLTPEEQDTQLKSILGPWPNTYTYTKSMAERTLRKTKPAHLPVCILRPSIIAASAKEPFPGWTDTLSAAGGLSVAGASGVLNYINTKKDNISDIIPVDYVSNAIIVSTVMCADKPGLTVVHSSSSHVNPVTWGEYLKYGFDFVTYQPLSTQVFKPKIDFVQNKKQLLRKFYWRSEVPTAILDKVSRIPGISSPKLKKDVS